MTLKQAVDVAVSMELVETEVSKRKGHDIVFTQWFRDGKANRGSQNCYYKNAKCQSCEGQVMEARCLQKGHLYTNRKSQALE